MKAKRLVLAAVALLAPVLALADPVVTITPSTTTAGTNSTVTVTVGISGLNSVTPNQIVSAYDLDVLYDPTLLGIQFGTLQFLSTAQFGSFSGLASNLPGDLDVSLNSFEDDATLAGLQGDAIALFSVDFLTGMTDGAAFLDFGADPLFQRLIVGLGGESANATFVGACIAIGNGSCAQAIPEPETAALLSIAALAAGLSLARRRRR